MLVYIIGFAMPVFFIMVRAWKRDNFIKRYFTDGRIVFWTNAYLFAISALRKSTIGADTRNYMNMYEDVARHGADYYLNHAARKIETGYVYFEAFCARFTQSPQVFLGIIAFIVAIVVGRFVKKYSKNAAWSMFFYMAYFFQFFGLTGCRQTMAAMMLMLSYDFIREKKFIKFTIMVALATMFHYSASMFFPMYFFADFKVTQKKMLIFFIATVMLFVMRQRFLGILANMMVRFTGDDYYGQYSYGVFNIRNYFMMAASLTALCVYRYKRVMAADPYAGHYYNGIFLSLLFATTGNTRLMQYFWIFILPLFPNVIKELRENDKLIVGTALPMVLGLLMLLSYSRYTAISPYKFFWQ